MLAIREAVGLSDVSTLGKFEVLDPARRVSRSCFHEQNIVAPTRCDPIRAYVQRSCYIFEEAVVARLDSQTFFITTSMVRRLR